MLQNVILNMILCRASSSDALGSEFKPNSIYKYDFFNHCQVAFWN